MAEYRFPLANSILVDHIPRFELTSPCELASLAGNTDCCVRILTTQRICPQPHFRDRTRVVMAPKEHRMPKWVPIVLALALASAAPLEAADVGSTELVRQCKYPRH